MGRNSTVGKGAEAGAGATPPLGTGRAGRDGAPVVRDPGRLRLRPPRRPPAGQSRPGGDAGAPTDLPAPAGRVAYGPAQPSLGPLADAVAHFRTVTASYWPGLFACYDLPDLPPTN